MHCFLQFQIQGWWLSDAVLLRGVEFHFKLAAGEILFVIHFSLEFWSRKLQTSCCFDGSLLKISFCSLSIWTDSDQSCSRTEALWRNHLPLPIDRSLCCASWGLCPITRRQGALERPPIKTSWAGKIWSLSGCLFWLGRMRGSPSPCRPRSLVSIFSLASPGVRGVRLHVSHLADSWQDPMECSQPAEAESMGISFVELVEVSCRKVMQIKCQGCQQNQNFLPKQLSISPRK